MNDLKSAFTNIKPLCDTLMANPTSDNISALEERIKDLKPATLQEMHLYVMFPVITHLRSKDIVKKYEMQRRLVEMIRSVLEKVTVTFLEMYSNYHDCLIGLVFDGKKPGMVANVPEELKYSLVRCLTVLMLNLNPECTIQVFKTMQPVQVVFVCTQIAKNDKMRSLRLSSIACVLAYTATHDKFIASNILANNKRLNDAVLDLVASILPGVVAALQDVANCSENPGHSIVVASINAMHRIVCLVMNNKLLTVSDDVSLDDFAKLLLQRARVKNEQVGSTNKSKKNMVKRSPEWYAMAGDKLQLVTESLIPLQNHEHYKVRRELAVYCSRLLFECSRTMQPSVPYALNTLITLSRDAYSEVSQYCVGELTKYFNNIPPDIKMKTMDSLAENFLVNLMSLPRILNNIDSSNKLSALNLLHGYLTILCDATRPQRLTNILSLHSTLRHLCSSLLEAVKLDASVCLLAQIAIRDITKETPTNAPWCRLRHLDDQACVSRIHDICRVIGEAESADFVVDQLLYMFDDSLTDRKEIVYILNCIGSTPKIDPAITKRILNKYLEESVWVCPLEVASSEEPMSLDETLDPTVYNPRAWAKDSVPGLYEGAIETRYTDISYAHPKVQRRKDPNYCANLAEAQNNMVLSCLLTEGVGVLAKRLMDEFQPYLLKTLSLILERVGSKYEMLHLAGLKSINDITIACGSTDVPELIRSNADYFTYQVTTRLKKSWNSQSALKILTVVMEYSDASILDCLYGIVTDVLVQSCDKYHENDLCAYLQVFLTFITCIRKWFPNTEQAKTTDQSQSQNIDSIDLFKDTIEYVKNTEEFDRLLNTEEDKGKSAKEMYLEDLKIKEEEDVLDYDDKVTEEKPPLPQHISLSVTILKRCLNFIPSKRRDERLLSLQVINEGLNILKEFEDELLPLVHQVWAPLVGRFTELSQPVVLRRALALLVTMADLSKDFIRNRTVKEVLPNLYKSLESSSLESYLKDVGSAYRQSHAFRLQVSALTALPTLVVDLCLDDDHLHSAMKCVQPYLSNKQPMPLQALAVTFFKVILDYDYGAAWSFLRSLCSNQCVMEPPKVAGLQFSVVVGTPFEPVDTSYKRNVNNIFSVSEC